MTEVAANQNNRDYVKHLIKCRCSLPHLKESPEAPLHKFIVFSEINHKAEIVPSLIQCPNCGIVHKIKEVGLSEILRREDLGSILTAKEIKASFPQKLSDMIDGYELEVHQLQEIKWILDNEAWGRTVVLARETTDDLMTGKYIQILSKDFYKFDSFSKDGADNIADINDN